MVETNNYCKRVHGALIKMLSDETDLMEEEGCLFMRETTSNRNVWFTMSVTFVGIKIILFQQMSFNIIGAYRPP